MSSLIYKYEENVKVGTLFNSQLVYIWKYLILAYDHKHCLLLCFSHKLEEEFELLKKSEVLYYSVEKKGNVSSQFKHHNPWSMKCHQQQLQQMKENAKHRNQYSILCVFYTTCILLYYLYYLCKDWKKKPNLGNIKLLKANVHFKLWKSDALLQC